MGKTKIMYSFTERAVIGYIYKKIAEAKTSQWFSEHEFEGSQFQNYLRGSVQITINPSTIARTWRKIREKGILTSFHLQILQEVTHPRKTGRGKGEKAWLINFIQNSPSTTVPSDAVK